MGPDDQLLPTQTRPKKYDVFVSFRGEDTRKSFTSHLHKALLHQNIETYIDERLVRGDEVSKSLLDAIQESRISVIVFSENYANSSWCLDELVHILHCRDSNDQIVLPVFYHVNPSDVRRQQGSYGAAFVKLERRFKDEIVHKWRTALTTAANLSGWDASITSLRLSTFCRPHFSRNDSELVETIVKDVTEKLNYRSSSRGHLKGLVGIESSIKEVESLLLSSSSDARIIGIWGMGGLGKTTLATAIFRHLYSQFEGHCFLQNVREDWNIQGSSYLQNKFFSQLWKQKDVDMENIQSTKERLCRRKLLIVLDDVEDLEQYERLVEDRDWLNSESRVIITTRNKQVLRNIGVHGIYKLKQLQGHDALQLFCCYAFKRNFSPESYVEMSTKLVNYCKGLPLALKVLGSHLYSKRKEEWRSTLNKLKVVPNKKIHNVLKISYDGLDREEKDIFLDIACFFQGRSRHFVEEILDDHGCFADVIQVLFDKSLVTLSYDGELQMHDLLQEMGWEITRGNQFHKELGKQSRLWITDDICHVLRNNTGTTKIEGIILRGAIREDINLKPIVFRKMRRLRLLQISVNKGQCQFHLPRGIHSFPDELRYLKWDNYPSKSLGLHTTLRNLVKLHMPSSQLEKFWNGFKNDLENLKFVDLRFSKKLTCLPDLSQSNLRRLDLQGCTSLVELPPLRFEHVLDKHTKETDVFLINNADMYNFPELDISLLKNSWTYDIDDYWLNLQGCTNLKTLSKMSGNIKYMCLRWTAIEELHYSSIRSLNRLILIDLKDCKCLKNLPSDICKMGSLKYLDLGGCLSIDKFPELPENIRGLDLSGTSVEQIVSSSFKRLPYLETLYMNNCARLEALPTSICKLKSLKQLTFSYCPKLKSFPEILEPMECLDVLYLNETCLKELPSSISNLVRLKILKLSYCKNLESIPTSFCKLKSLKRLIISHCSKLKIFPEIMEPMRYLQFLYLNGTGIKEIPSSIESLVGLHLLDLSECRNLEYIPSSICKLKFLQKLILSYCSSLKSFPQIWEPMGHLEDLLLIGTGIKELPWSIGNLINLKCLSLNWCENLEFVPASINYMWHLNVLSLMECPRLKSLPIVGVNLQEIYVDLSYANILKICNWLDSSSSLEMLDPSGTTTGRIPIHISRNHGERKTFIKMCKCSCFHQPFLSSTCARKGLFFFRNHVGRHQCSIALARYTQYWFDFQTEFPYCEYCLKFDEIRNILMTEFQLNVLHMAISSIFICGEHESNHHGISFCYSGNEIPEWFSTCQAAGSTIDINFSQLWRDTGFFGFALCIVVDFENMFLEDPNYLALGCEYHFKTTYGESYKYRWTLQKRHDASSNNDFLHRRHDLYPYNESNGRQHDDAYSLDDSLQSCYDTSSDDDDSLQRYLDADHDDPLQRQDNTSSDDDSLQFRHDAYADDDSDSKSDMELDWSSYVFIWHLYENDYYDYHGATGASFDFYVDGQTNAVFGKQRIRKCGVRMLSLQDAREFGILKYVQGENSNSNTIEPHHKRIKLSNS
ncbi:TIR-NBS-LRR-like protein [Parasponia andersonii]|uniref:ADP-ribosyl cyclase/cyclic ADP-ribose hydrolase n=1 Tax=Parasponia andersonii TaxID=3476 RepID=A0A2P5BRY7_PARAD|nr:TIR-NBS-LRR-like protein [Parasponia andersonii]